MIFPIGISGRHATEIPDFPIREYRLCGDPAITPCCRVFGVLGGKGQKIIPEHPIFIY